MDKENHHIKYEDKHGDVVPSVTQIIGVMDKGEDLIKWANWMGKKGEDCIKFRDDAAQVGTLAHMIIGEYLGGEETDHGFIDTLTQSQVDKANNALRSFELWYKDEITDKGKTLEVIAIEKSIVSDYYRYAGTIDLLAKIDNELVLIDFKTSSKISLEHKIQVVAYGKLLNEKLGSIGILRLGKKDISEWEYCEIEYLGEEEEYLWYLFKSLLESYCLINGLKEYYKKNRKRKITSNKSPKKENKENENLKLSW